MAGNEVTAARRRNRRGQGERLRDDLLDAADGILTEHGSAAAVSLRAVAARAGVAATSVYLHFDSVEGLKMALAQRYFADFWAVRTAAAEPHVDPTRRLVAGCQAYAQYGVSQPGRYRLMFGPDLTRLTAGATPPDPRTPVEPSQAAFTGLVDAIAACQRAGQVPADSHANQLALLIWTSLHGQVTLRIDRPTYPWPPPDDMIREVVLRILDHHDLRPTPGAT